MSRLYVAIAVAFLCTTVRSQFIRNLPADYDKLKGEDVVLVCEVENSGTFPIIWRHGDVTIAILSEMSGTIHIANPNRTSAENGFNLKIRNLDIDDEGDYTCEITGHGQITHRLTVNIPPSVELEPGEDEINILLGRTALLTCDAYGRPDPTIKWRRSYGQLPNGLDYYEGSTLVLNNTGKMDTGYYQCEATNIAGKATAAIQVNIHYKPTAVIETQNGLIHGGPGEAIDIICLNDGNPRYRVLWRHNGLPIDMETRRNIQILGVAGGLPEESHLTFRPLSEADFGTYLCFVNNSLGQASSQVQLTGTPYDISITSSPDGQYSDAFDLTWQVRSHVPLKEYYLWTKPAFEDSTDLGEPATDMPDKNVTYSVDEDIEEQPETVESDGWHKRVLPAGEAPSSEHRMTYAAFTLDGLQANTTYLAKVQANNQFGDSEVSEVFSFTTSADGSTYPPPTPDQPDNTEEKTDAMATTPKKEVKPVSGAFMTTHTLSSLSGILIFSLLLLW